MKKLSLITFLASLFVSSSVFSQETLDKPITVLKNKNLKLNTTYGTNDNHGWAFINYIVNESGELIDFDIINASNFREAEKDVEKFLNNLEFSPATVNGEPTTASRNYFYRLKYHRKKHSHNKVSKAFYQDYETIQSLLDAQQVEKAKIALEEISQHRVKNWVEQAMYYWQKSQLHYYQGDWQNYEQAIDDVFNLSQYLPEPIAVPALQNAIEWYVHDKDYSKAKLSLKRLQDIKNLVLDEKAKQDYQALIDVPLRAKDNISIEKTLAKAQVFYRKMTRPNGQIEIKKGALDIAEIRCANGIIKLTAKEKIYQFNNKGYNHCHILLKAKELASFNLLQTSQLL